MENHQSKKSMNTKKLKADELENEMKYRWSTSEI